MHFLEHIYIIFILLFAVSGCAPLATASYPSITEPKLGDRWARTSDGMEMVFVPGGSFSMGSDREKVLYAVELCKEYTGNTKAGSCQYSGFSDEQPAHTVKLKSFWIDLYEVTNGQYQACVEVGACSMPRESSSYTRESYYGNPPFNNHPVINIEWAMAADYCSWAGARLPTEAEWEYGARGLKNRIFPWGNTFEKSRLNYCDAGCGFIADKTFDDGNPDTAPVGSFPNGISWIGAFDMAGNVREWVRDNYGRYTPGEVENPTGPAKGDMKIPRGGSWFDTPDDIRSSNRGGEALDYYRYNLGFRCAMGQQS